MMWPLLVILGFCCEFIDSTLGMGYGTILMPALLLLGYPPLSVIPALLISQMLTGLTAGLCHHWANNVNFRLPTHRNVASVIAMCSVVGTIGAIILVINIPTFWLKFYIGTMITVMGLLILFLKRKWAFSWKKIVGLGTIAAFNKGMSGGGYGPLITAGQVVSGMDGKNAIGITSLAEGLVCLVGVATWFILGRSIEWSLAIPLVSGAIVSAPLSALVIKKLNTRFVKVAIGVATLILGIFTLGKCLL